MIVIRMKVFDDFRYGLRSMAPTGVWLPWEEVLFMAGQFGLAPDTCQAAAEAWCSVGAADLDPRPRDCTSGQYVRVHLLPLGDDTDVLSVSSDDDTAAEETQMGRLLQPRPVQMGLWLSTSPCLSLSALRKCICCRSSVTCGRRIRRTQHLGWMTGCPWTYRLGLPTCFSVAFPGQPT